MDNRRKKLPVPHVHKAGECFSIKDISEVLPWTPEPQERSSDDESQEDAEDDTRGDEGNTNMEASDTEEEDCDSNEDEEFDEEDEESGDS